MIDRNFKILGAVGFEPISMKLCTVYLETDQVVDHKVNSLEVAESDLTLHGVTREPQPSPRKAFGQRFALHINPAGDAPPLIGEPQDERLKLDHVDRSGMQRPIEGGHRHFEILIIDYANERVSGSD